MRVADGHGFPPPFCARKDSWEDETANRNSWPASSVVGLANKFMKDSSSRRRALCQAGPHALLTRVTYG